MNTELRDIITAHTGRPDFGADAVLYDLFDDELDVLEFIFAVEEEFGIEIPDDVADTLDTLSKLEEFVQGLRVATPTKVAAREKIPWRVRAHLAQDVNSTVDRIHEHHDLSDDLGIADPLVGMFVFAFVQKHFGVSIELTEANRVMTVADLTTLIVSNYESAGLECLCAMMFLHDGDEVSMVACNKPCPRKAAITAMGGLPPE